MGVFINPFDFQKIFVNYLLGGMEYFIFAFVLLMSFVAAKFNMSNKVYFILLGIGSVIFASVLEEPIYILVVFVVGVLTFKGVSRLTQ